MRGRAASVAIPVFALCAFATSSEVQRAHACTAPAGGLPEFSVADRVADASLVIRGTVVATEEHNFLKRATIVVHEYYKGGGTALVLIEGFGPSSLCKSDVAVGDTLVFYASGTPGATQANYLTQYDAVAAADEAKLSEIQAATGQPATAPDPETRRFMAGVGRDANAAAESVEQSAPGAESSSWSTVAGAAAAISLFALGLIAVGRRRLGSIA